MTVPQYVDNGLLDMRAWEAESGGSSLGSIVFLVVTAVVVLVCVVYCVYSEREALEAEKAALEAMGDEEDPESEEEAPPVPPLRRGGSARSAQRPPRGDSVSQRNPTPAGMSASEHHAPLMTAGDRAHDPSPVPRDPVPAFAQPPPPAPVAPLGQVYEVRQDPANSNYYPLESFIECYGEEEGLMIWSENAATAQFSNVPFEEI